MSTQPKVSPCQNLRALGMIAFGYDILRNLIVQSKRPSRLIYSGNCQMPKQFKLLS